MNNHTGLYPQLPTMTTSQNLVSHAGLSTLTGLLNTLGFRQLAEDRLSQFVPATATHRPGKMISDLVLMLASGGEHVTDTDQLRTTPGVFGQVASEATFSRFFTRLAEHPGAFDYAFATMQREVRSRLWAAAGKRSPAVRATRTHPLIVDIDASLVHVHSDKEGAKGTYKRGYGFAPMIAMADYGQGHGTGEVLAVRMRPGNKGANSAADHISILTEALAQLPDDFYDQNGCLIGEKILVRTDSAGASREFLHHLDALGLQFSTSYALPVVNERFIGWINEKKYWEPALTATGEQREDAWVIDATKILGLRDYPPGTRIYLRAEPLHPGAKASLFDTDGNRVTAFLTNAPRFDPAFLDVRHRARGRCENRIKSLKAAGLGKLPFFAFGANQAWANLAMFALNLVIWLQLAVLPAEHIAGCWDLKRWRYRVWSLAGKLVTGSRQPRLLVNQDAPEAGLVLLLQERISLLAGQWRNGHLAA
ncbi:IS1380 family transposase [Glutamicibacter sp. FR1]|uniref:IS1380 family transposase n=1 Tax=Glutamicibacter sp. FR1 TaxID=3393744 RepID=UPI0039AF55CF